ncbi:MAG: DUF523 and DUF1722 domain-containing protein [bacterium]
MKDFPTPVLVVSKCLGFAPVRYNGEVLHDEFVKGLEDFVSYVPVCPEVEIGLGIPRKPVRLVLKEGTHRMVQPATGQDFTEQMQGFADSFLSSLSEVDGFIVKSRSPTSGIKDVKVYPGLEKVAAVDKGAGLFGGEILKRFPRLPAEDEGRLSNFNIRESFLTRVFNHADFRRVKESGKTAELINFHSRNKLLFMAYNQKELKSMGSILANPQKKKFPELVREYEEHLLTALDRTPRRTSIINVLMHAFGYFKKSLAAREKAYFLDSLEKYRNGELPLIALQTVLKSWALRYESDYLLDQTFFQPFPEGIIGFRDSGKAVQR